jgi:hypothetical protein
MKKKILFISVFVLLITGCAKSDLKKSFNKMDINLINNYSVDLRINGEINDTSIKISHRIINYNNEQISISFSERNDEIRLVERNYVYQDGILYSLKDDIYEISEDELNFKNTSILLEGLNNTEKASKEEVESDLYNKLIKGTLEKKYVVELLSEYKLDTNFETATFEFHLNDDDTVQRIIYQIDDLTINALFYSIGTSTRVNIN